jgi:hypothetical protein
LHCSTAAGTCLGFQPFFYLQEVFRIRDLLVEIRPAPDPALFVSDLSCLLLFEGTFTSFFKDKRFTKSHKTVEIMVFLTIFV